MFTGIIEEIGTIKALRRGSHSAVLTVGGKIIFEDLNLGDSVSLNGVCLTVTDLKNSSFDADVMHETLSRSSLGVLKVGSHVNLERALAVNGRFGGHIVSGHIDGIGKISNICRDDNAIWYTIHASPELLHYIIEKGSIAIDGISLTVAKTGTTDFSVSIIPHTARATTLFEKKIGDIVNLENDVIGKYVERLLDKKEPLKSENRITNEFLKKFSY